MQSDSNLAREINSLVQTFVGRLTDAVEQSVAARFRNALSTALGAPVRRGPGRPPKAESAVTVSSGFKIRKKAPKQLCPVPGCKNAAAPVYGMVCSTHKGVAKSKINAYREARRKAKAKG